MKRTDYLFDQPRSKYEPEITELATKRVADAKTLLAKLSRDKNGDLSHEEMDAIIQRYIQVADAKRFWEGILNEE